MPDATQEEILRGFLQAASSATDDYDIARQFLTSDYRAQWDPNMQVTVDEGIRAFTPHGPDTVSLTIQGVASIDDRGVLTQLMPKEKTQVPFELQKEKGEWRISSAPNGVILDKATFLDVWSSHPLYFLAKDGGLVAEQRWFLNRATMATQIVSQLLEGPSENYKVLGSAFPSGTRLASDAVIIDGVTARVDLTSDFDQITEESLGAVQTQLAASLYSVPGVTHFAVSVGNAEVLSGDVSSPDISTSDTIDSGLTVGVIANSEFGYYSSSGFTSRKDLGEQFPSANVTALTLSRNGDQAVALTDAGVTWIDESGNLVIDDRKSPIAPTIDNNGYVWLGTLTVEESITAWHPTRDNATLATPDTVRGATIVAHRISPDGTRIAFLMTEGKGFEGNSKVVVHSITRDEAGAPTQLVNTDTPLVAWTNGKAIDFDWIDTQRMSIVSEDGPDSSVFTITGPGLFSESRTGISNVVGVRSGGRLPLTYLLTSKGTVVAPQGTSGWQEYAKNIDVLSKRG